jgi:hypothetical protein
MALLARARERDRAPDALRDRIERDRAAASAAVSRRRRGGLAAVAVAGLAAVAAVLAIVLPAGTPGGPSISQAAGLSLRGAARPAPATAGPGILDARLGEISFPDWQGSFGWRAVGSRTDTLGGRTALTVYYARGTSRIAYTILDPPALSERTGAVMRLGQRELHVMRVGQRTVVSWHEQDSTCILASSTASTQQLARLALWS